MVFIEKMFTNECEKEKDGFDEIGYQIFLLTLAQLCLSFFTPY